MQSWGSAVTAIKKFAPSALALTLGLLACPILIQECAAPVEEPVQVQAVETPVWYASAFVPACGQLTGVFDITFTVDSEVVNAQFPVTVTGGVSPTILSPVDLPKFETEIGTVWADGLFLGMCSGKLQLAPVPIVGYDADGIVQDKTENGYFVMDLTPAEFQMFLPVVVR